MNIRQLPIMQELDEEPTEEELRKAKAGKASGEDSIPGGGIKAGKEELIEDLHECAACAGRRVLYHKTCAAAR